MSLDAALLRQTEAEAAESGHLNALVASALITEKKRSMPEGTLEDRAKKAREITRIEDWSLDRKTPFSDTVLAPIEVQHLIRDTAGYIDNQAKHADALFTPDEQQVVDQLFSNLKIDHYPDDNEGELTTFSTLWDKEIDELKKAFPELIDKFPDIQKRLLDQLAKSFGTEDEKPKKKSQNATAPTTTRYPAPEVEPEAPAEELERIHES